jgi:hypothetical protein
MDYQSVPTSVIAPLWFLSPEVCDLEVQTDASNLGYGIWYKRFLHQGLWDGTAAHLHINVLETTALCTSWPTSSQSCQSNATSFGGSTTPLPWLTSRRKGVHAVHKS